MYNEEQKLKYLRVVESDSSSAYISTMFNRFEKYETKCSKDIAYWDESSIYKTISAMSFDYGTIKQYLSILSAYRAWACCKYSPQGYQKLNADNVDLSGAIQSCLIRSPAALKNELANVIELDQGYYIVAAACFAWLGIDMKTMPFLKDSSVNFIEKSIIDEACNIEIHHIDKEIIDILQEYWTTTEAIRMHKTKCKAYPLYNGMFLHLMVGANSKKKIKPINYDSIRKEFGDLASRAMSPEGEQSRLSCPNLLRAGGLYRLYQLEKSGVDIFSGKSDELLLKTYSAPGKTYDIRSLYRQYKKAFNL